VNIDDNQEIDQDLTLIYNSSSDIKSIEYNNNKKSIVWLENDVIKKAHFDLKYDTQIEIKKSLLLLIKESLLLDSIGLTIFYTMTIAKIKT
jgi:hypothetical protein